VLFVLEIARLLRVPRYVRSAIPAGGRVGEIRGSAGRAAARASTEASSADAGRVGVDAASMDTDTAAIDEETLRSGPGMGAKL